MKTKHLFLALLVCLIGFAGCGDKDNDPQVFTAPANSVAFGQDTYPITSAYHIEADNEHEYAFISGTEPGCVLKFESREKLVAGVYDRQVEGEIEIDRQDYDITSCHIHVDATSFSMHDARAGGRDLAFHYDGPVTEIGHNGTGSLTAGSVTNPIDGAVVSASRLGNYDVLLLLLTSATTSAEADLVFRGTSLAPGNYPIGDALTLLGGGCTGQINDMELQNGSVTIAQDGSSYTITASGTLQTGASFSLTYTGAIARL